MSKSSEPKGKYAVVLDGEEVARTDDEAEAQQLASGLNGAEVKASKERGD